METIRDVLILIAIVAAIVLAIVWMEWETCGHDRNAQGKMTIRCEK